MNLVLVRITMTACSDMPKTWIHLHLPFWVSRLMWEGEHRSLPLVSVRIGGHTYRGTSAGELLHITTDLTTCIRVALSRTARMSSNGFLCAMSAFLDVRGAADDLCLCRKETCTCSLLRRRFPSCSPLSPPPGAGVPAAPPVSAAAAQGLLHSFRGSDI